MRRSEELRSIKWRALAFVCYRQEQSKFKNNIGASFLSDIVSPSSSQRFKRMRPVRIFFFHCVTQT